jgi:hypothetical protein
MVTRTLWPALLVVTGGGVLSAPEASPRCGQSAAQLLSCEHSRRNRDHKHRHPLFMTNVANGHHRPSPNMLCLP